MSRGAYDFAALAPLREQAGALAPLETFRARDGAALGFRRYPAAPGATTQLILAHGSSGHGAVLHVLARALAATGAAHVITPDLRGHGPAPARRGDIDAIGQLEDDLADLADHLGAGAPGTRLIVGGHSSGGGLALRFAAGRYRDRVDGLLLLAPYLGHAAPMARRGAGGWVRADVPRIVLLLLLNRLGIRRFNGATVLRFDLPERYRSGHETLRYSFRMMRGLHPDDFRAALRRCAAPVLVLVGDGDEAFHVGRFRGAIQALNPRAEVEMLPGESHLGILVSGRAVAPAQRWIGALEEPRAPGAAAPRAAPGLSPRPRSGPGTA